jgi:hypothetical protein
VSDARTDFFSSAAKASKAASRDDFFAGNYSPPEEKPTADYSKPYAYFTPEVQREVGNDGTGARPLEEIPGGFNQGVAHLLGLPVTALVDAANLSSAGMGYLQSKVTGEAPSHIFDPVDPALVPLTGAWNEQLLNSTPMGDVTSVRNPDNAVARVVHAAASGVPGGLLGGAPSAPAVLSGMAGAGAAGISSELGADPATQSVVSLLAGSAAAKIPAAKAPAPKPTAQQKLDTAASKQSMGAAGAAVDLQKLSPALRADVEQAVQKTGGAVNPDVLARAIQADSLPVPVRLSEGQKLGDPRLISEERNARGATPGFVEGFEAQNKALIENMRVFRDTAGEDVFSTNHAEHADTLIARYKAIDDARNADIGSKYQALRDAAGGAFPVDTQTLLTNVRAALKKGLATSKAPSDVMGLLEEKAASGSMTLEDFEDIRTSLARTQRSASDGQERHAAGVIRRQIEEMPLQEGAKELKGLADAARNAARDRFQALDADPAYKAAVEGTTTPPDKFVQKFVIGGARDDVAKLSEAMSGDEHATQTLKVATLDHLRQAAGSRSGLQRQLHSSTATTRRCARSSRSWAHWSTRSSPSTCRTWATSRATRRSSPEGHFVNNSNTFVAQRALAHGADALEGAANVKAGGIPVGTWVAPEHHGSTGRKAAAKTFAPGSGPHAPIRSHQAQGAEVMSQRL